MTDTRSTLQGVKPHDKYYLDGGDLHIIAEDREFRVHRYFFERDSVKFRNLLASPSPGAPRQGSSHLTAVKLQGVTAKDFEKFLWVFYNPTYSLYDATVSDWCCILHLGHDWQFEEVEKLAVRELEKITSMSVVDRIALYQKHNVTEDLIIPHYAMLCTRGPLDLDESQRLGMSTVVLINQAMHSIHTPRDGEGTSSPIDPVNTAVISKIAAHIGKSGQPGAGSGPSGELGKAFPPPIQSTPIPRRVAPPSGPTAPRESPGSPMAKTEQIDHQTKDSRQKFGFWRRLTGWGKHRTMM